MDSFKELIAIIIGLIIVLFPFALRFLFYSLFRTNRDAAKPRNSNARQALLQRPRMSAPKPSTDAKRDEDEQFLMRIQRNQIENIGGTQKTDSEPGSFFPPIPEPVETRTPEDTVLPANTFDHIIGGIDERTPEDTVLPGQTVSRLLHESDDTVLPQSMLDRIFPESRENDQVIPSRDFGRIVRQVDERPARGRKTRRMGSSERYRARDTSLQDIEAGDGASRDSASGAAGARDSGREAAASQAAGVERTGVRTSGWSRINRLPLLKRAIVLAEVLRSPRAIEAQGEIPGMAE